MTDITTDQTFHPTCMYGSTRWAAVTLGISEDNLYKKRSQWVADLGFPAPDTINKHYLKADLLAWIERRRRISDLPANQITVGASTIIEGPRTDDL